MARSIWLVVAWLFAALPVSADIFKCAEKNGMDRYQNFPCSFDSIGSLAPGLPSVASTSRPGDASWTKPTPLAVASAGRPSEATEPRIGMTQGEVTAIWGEPLETDEDERKEGRIEIWRYADGRSVQFSSKRRVFAMQR